MHPRWIALSLAALVAVAIAAAVVARRPRPSGLSALAERAVPGADCRLTVQLDRTSFNGQAVQFGDLACPEMPPEPALRIGGRWFALPPRALGSKYGLVRRSENNLAWVIAADFDFFRSDDGGETFALLHLPGWGESIAHVAWFTVKGLSLENFSFGVEPEQNVVERVAAALTDPSVGSVGVRARVAMARAALSGRGSPPPPTVHWQSNDGGRTWWR